MTLDLSDNNRTYSLKHIGNVITTKEGYTATVIAGGLHKGECVIQIHNYITTVLYSNLVKRTVRYPYHKTVYGIGFFGEGKYKAKVDKHVTKHYDLWTKMLQRCYDEKCQLKHPTYVGVTVCKEWHNFQNFAEWVDKNYVYNWHIDKDLIDKEAKKYSPETCLFVPRAINNFIVSGYSPLREVRNIPNSSKFFAQISIDGKMIHLGVYESATEANKVYEDRRMLRAKALREEYKDSFNDEILLKIV